MADEKKIIYKDGKDTGEAYGPDEGYPMWMLRQGAIGIGDTPGSFAALYGLGKAAAGYLYDRVDPTAPSSTPFKDYLFDEGGKEKLLQYDQGVRESLRQSYPNISEQELDAKLDSVRKHSKKYFRETSDFYRPGISFARKWGVGTNEFFGDPRLPTERTQADTLMNIAGGAVPLPGASALLSATGQTGARIAATTTGKIALNALEFATPATIPYSPGRLAANIALPTAIDQAARLYNDDPSVIKDAANSVSGVFKKPDGTTDTETATAAGITAGVAATVLGAKGLRYLLKSSPTPPSGGPTRAAMEEAAHPTASSVKMTAAQVGSDVEPARVMAKEVGLSDDEVAAYMTKINREAGPMSMADHSNWMNQKVSPIFEPFMREDPRIIESYLQHASDRARVHGDAMALKETEDLLTDKIAKLQRAQAAGSRTSQQTIANLTNEVHDLTLERQARLQDSDPNLRYMNISEPSSVVRQRYNQSRNDPRIRAIEAQLKPLYHEINDLPFQGGMTSQATALRGRNAINAGNWSVSENPLAQKSWLAAQKHDALKWADSHLVYAQTDGALGLYRMIHNPTYRRGYEDPVTRTARYVNPRPGVDVPQPRVNNPRDPFSELNYLSLRTRQAVAANNVMRDYTEMMMRSPGNANRRYMTTERIPEAQVAGKLNRVVADMNREKGPYTYAYYDRGDLVVVKHNEKIINDMFKFAPTQVVPIINEARKFTQGVLTGPGRPGWVATGVPYDILMGGLWRDPHMVYGIINRSLADMFGRGSFIHRYVGAVATFPDAVYHLMSHFGVGIKSAVVEALGNQLAKRWEAQLASNTGLFAVMSKIPGLQNALPALAKVMSQAYDNSWVQMTKAYKVGHVSNFNDDLLTHIRRLDDLSKKTPLYKSMWRAYKSVLTVLHDVPKQIFLSQNLKLYQKELARGRQLPSYFGDEFIKDQARMIGGDLARVSGNPYMQRAMSGIMYGNVMQQSLRYTYRRMMENPTENFIRLASMGTGIAWLYHNIAMDDKASDWFFNQIPEDQRAQSIPLPNPVYLAKRMAGYDVSGDPSKNYTLVKMPPEMMPFIIPVLHGMMMLGFINTKKAVVPPSLSRDMKHAVDQVFGLSLPVATSGIAGYFGKKIEPSKTLTGETPFRDIRDTTLAGVNKDKMSPESRIPHAWYDAFNGMFGVNAATIMEAANFGDITAARTGSLTEGIKGGVKKLAIEQASRFPGGHYVWPEVTRNYIQTPFTEKHQKDMSILRAVDEQVRNEPGIRAMLEKKYKPNTMDIVGATPGANTGPPVADPDVRAVIASTHLALFTGPYRELEKQRRIERRKHEALTVGADPSGPTSPLMRFKAAQDQAKKVNRLDLELYNRYQDIWKEIQNSPSGKAFEMKFGPLTPENLLKATQASASQAARRPY